MRVCPSIDEEILAHHKLPGTIIHPQLYSIYLADVAKIEMESHHIRKKPRTEEEYVVLEELILEREQAILEMDQAILLKWIKPYLKGIKPYVENRDRLVWTICSAYSRFRMLRY